jgi:transcriptional regulator with XRE-family HTH domain
MDISTIIGLTADTVVQGIAERVKARRLEKDLTQKAFAARAGIGYDAYRRFEATGEISLRNLAACAMVLDNLEEFNQLFESKQYSSLDALLETKHAKTKKRGTRNE